MEQEQNGNKMGVFGSAVDRMVQANLILQGEVLSCTDGSEKECFSRLLLGTNKVYAPGFMKIKKRVLPVSAQPRLGETLWCF